MTGRGFSPGGTMIYFKYRILKRWQRFTVQRRRAVQGAEWFDYGGTWQTQEEARADLEALKRADEEREGEVVYEC